MKRKIQINLSEEAWELVEGISNEASQNFELGSIGYSDVINEMILTSKVDIKTLQLKNTDLRRTLRVMATKDSVDLDGIIKSLTELKAKGLKKKFGNHGDEVSS
jgi:hypothetical protein